MRHVREEREIEEEPVGEVGASGVDLDGDEDRAVPVRFWWFKRLAIGVAALVAVTVGLRLWWGWEVERRLDAEIERLRAAGEPVYPADFNPRVDIPDEENAAAFYMRAASQLNLTQAERKALYDLSSDREAVQENVAMLERLLDANRESLSLVREARGLEKVDWGVRMTSPMIMVLLPNLSGQRDLSRFLAAVARWEAEQGDGDAAFTLLEDMLAHARVMDRHPSLIAHLVAIGFYWNVTRTIEDLLPQIDLAGGDDATSKAGVSRGRMEALIADLLDDDAYAAARVLAIQSERALVLDSVTAIADGNMAMLGMTGGAPTGVGALAARFLVPRPLVMADAHQVFLRFDGFVEAARQQTWPAAAKHLRQRRGRADGLDYLLRATSRMVEPSVDRAIFLHYRCLAHRRMAAVALAIRVYEVERGEKPPSLDVLVPKYIQRLPSDPLHVDGRPPGYLPAATWPRLYSVGADGIDEGGVLVFQASGLNYDAGDMPFFLTGERPESEADLLRPPSVERAGNEDE